MAKKMTVNDLQVTERSQCAKIDLLSCRSIRTVRQGLDVGRKVLNPLDLMPWQKDAAKFRQVKPFVGGALYATEVEIERVNVHVGFHWRAQKKQEPPPKERLRALLVKQSGVMMTRFLPVAWAVVKSVTPHRADTSVYGPGVRPFNLDNLCWRIKLNDASM